MNDEWTEVLARADEDRQAMYALALERQQRAILILRDFRNLARVGLSQATLDDVRWLAHQLDIEWSEIAKP